MGGADESLTVAILREIRDEIRGTRTDLGAAIDRTNERLDNLFEEQVRLSAAVAGLQKAQHETTEILGVAVREIQNLSGRLDHVLIGPMGKTVRDHEERIRRLELRGKTAARTGKATRKG